MCESPRGSISFVRASPARVGLGVIAATCGLMLADPSLSRAEPAVAAAKGADPSNAPALATLLTRLAHHAEQFEQMKRRGSFTMSGHMEELDGSGHVDGKKEMVLRVTATPAERRTEIVKYTEDGADKTLEAQQKAIKRRAEKKKNPDRSRDLHLPFLASEQPRYVFAIAERPTQNPTHVRVSFQPLAPAENAFKGSAWVDESLGEVLTMGFSPTKNPTFVDHVDVTMRFDLATPLGRAPSSIVFDARGGFLVVRKHYRGSAMITDPRVGF